MSSHSLNKNSKKSKTSKTSKTNVKSIMAAENYVNRPSGYNITRSYVPVIRYTHTDKDSYDGIVFLVAHSQFIGRLCHLQTKPGMKQDTLLVSNIGNSCIWISQPQMFEAFIRSRFSDALSYLPTDIEDFIHTVKGKTGKLEKTAEKIKTNPLYQGFFGTRGKHSVDQYEYCEREWQFFTQDKHKKPNGRVVLLRRDKKGNPYFKVLYENEIDQGDFHLTKTQLFNKLYSNPYHLRKVLLVDFGCTNTHSVSARNLQRLHSGRFGGTRKYK
jgi:hypothetical protein